MPTKPELSAEAVTRRRRAEERLQQQRAKAGGARTEADTVRLMHELEVHQIELEMQNEELERAWKEQAEGLEKYTDLFDFAPVGYLTLDAEGTIVEANLRSASLLGVDRSRLLTRRLGFFIAPADRAAFADLMLRVFAGGTREWCEVAIPREGKPPLFVQIKATVAAAGRVCRAVLTDLTERKRAEADRLILDKLESAGILAGGIAHDFNNLLAVILLDLDLARLRLPPGNEAAALLADAKQGVFRAQALTAQFITFAEGGTPLQVPTHLAGLIRETTGRTLHGSLVKEEVSVAADLWWTDVDHRQIEQVIRNIVLNARDAMLGGGVVAVRADNVEWEASQHVALSSGRYVRMSFTDQGGGIPPEVLPKIFDPYFSTKARGNQKGMGLGLTICHAIVRKHGGAMTVDSTVGVGTTFHVYLPAVEPVSGSRETARVRQVAPA